MLLASPPIDQPLVRSLVIFSSPHTGKSPRQDRDASRRFLLSSLLVSRLDDRCFSLLSQLERWAVPWTRDDDATGGENPSPVIGTSVFRGGSVFIRIQSSRYVLRLRSDRTFTGFFDAPSCNNPDVIMPRCPDSISTLTCTLRSGGLRRRCSRCKSRRLGSARSNNLLRCYMQGATFASSSDTR